MPLPVEHVHLQPSLETLLRDVVIGSLSFLVALEFREFLTEIIEALVPGVRARDKIVYTLFVLVLIMFITIIMIVYWRED